MWYIFIACCIEWMSWALQLNWHGLIQLNLSNTNPEKNVILCKPNVWKSVNLTCINRILVYSEHTRRFSLDKFHCILFHWVNKHVPLFFFQSIIILINNDTIFQSLWHYLTMNNYFNKHVIQFYRVYNYSNQQITLVLHN
jgi:hypothetical protein